MKVELTEREQKEFFQYLTSMEKKRLINEALQTKYGSELYQQYIRFLKLANDGLRCRGVPEK